MPQKMTTLSQHLGLSSAAFNKDALFVWCNTGNDADVERIRQMHDLVRSPTDKMMSPVSQALRNQRAGKAVRKQGCAA